MKLNTPSAQAAEIVRLAEALAAQAETREPLQLAGSKEAAAIIDVGLDSFYTLRKRHQLPAPVAELACGPVWRVEDLEAFKRVETVTVRDAR
jgi:hypothetical protein